MKPQSIHDEMEQETTTPAKRRKAMFFEKIGESKEIPFKTTLWLYREAGGKDHFDYFTTGALKEISETDTGFRYTFHDDKTGETDHSFTHWLLPVKP